LSTDPGRQIGYRVAKVQTNHKETGHMSARVTAVSRNAEHTFVKGNQQTITLVEGLGVEGDAHAGTTVQHLSRIKVNPLTPNLRQVHLIHTELHEELRGAGFDVLPGQMGENVTTEGLDLLGLPTGTRLHLGAVAVVEVTGLRNPCGQLDGLQQGLMAATLDRDEQGNLIRKAGIMGVVLIGGVVEKGDPIVVELPPEPHTPLIPV
jgi:MOSC domain-containing protein YiiM